MQKMIPTRTADQCRGHHRKVEAFAETKDIGEIIQFLTKKEGRKRGIGSNTEVMEEENRLEEERGG